MSKGLQLTLMTVAVALIGMRAIAMAPVIDAVPDPIVSDDQGVTDASGLKGAAIDNLFVYPDALNIPSYASDPDSGPNPLVFSVMVEDGKYLFNGVGPNPADPVDPGADGKDIINNADPAEEDPDSNPATVTIRNNDLSPMGGPNVDPGAPGIVASETRVVTLVASDGGSTTERDFIVYTENDGTDRISGAGQPTNVMNYTPSGSDPLGWLFFNEFAAFGTVTSSVNNALCMASTPAGINGAEWYSPYGEPGGVDLVDNEVYRFRFNFTTDQTTVGNTPLISVVIDNTDPADAFGALNLYNQENFRLDNFGGANSPAAASFGVQTHDFWFAPIPFQNAEWRSTSAAVKGKDKGVFAPGNDALNDMRVRFRIFDIDGGGWNAEADSGMVCLNNLLVDRFPFDTLSVASTPFDAQNIVDGSGGASGDPNQWTVAGLVNSTVTFSGGNVSVTPTSGNYDVELASFTPGDTNNNPGVGGPTIVDNYPVAWPSNAIFQVVAGLSGTSSGYVDAIRLGMDGPTQEVITLGVVTASALGVGMPDQTGGPYNYYSFVHSGQTTLSTVSEHDRLRPRMDFICTPALSFDGITTNMGGLTMNSMTVNIVELAP